MSAASDITPEQPDAARYVAAPHLSGDGGAARGPAVYQPRPVSITANAEGIPFAVGGAAVDVVREEWLVEDRWWTPRPLRRLYFELVLADGRCVVVFRDLEGGRWFSQRS